ncbi:hypothetical protein [Williamsia herbipolensis]|uniref:hypothetical protein n=1 Tax=Williamsia herbipolensis TaxID=1603258 RepID=UPI0005F84981|nr:hypothetical protein [Williamsia herbipolensis]
MIGAVVLEWFFQASRKPNHRRAEAQLDQRGFEAAADATTAKLAEVEARLLDEDAKVGADYDPDLVYMLLAERRILEDRRSSEHFGALVAWSDSVQYA